ncbi:MULTISPECIES: helix-turn-helix transcriptional regulator [Methylomonas]|uniref:Helix-turn-helix domain-containing protein n=2 Tax=Methylomonas TaxID=416 RepID=A0A140E4T0_9GAMM|nr:MULTISPECIES: helix-turn-helix domain-containing protein [Methylomonas]AMK75404.1 hypothetical protein JT25_002685 [Methylomonas denitrificans]OAI01192.1 hypothetical protein A1342_19260 [Methylomonas methanica]TCV78098.1 excisionase family DNA binding protein [Methylomonas methanica]
MNKIEDLQREVASNEEAAAYLGVKVSTLYNWSSTGNGPIKPVKIGGKLRWRIADLKALVAGSAE